MEAGLRDEFDGNALDESKWEYRLNFWGYRSPTWTTEGVEVADSNLTIKMLRRGDDFFSAHLQTGSLTFDNPREPDVKKFWPFGKLHELKYMHGYGYYEIRCKLPKKPGWHYYAVDWSRDGYIFYADGKEVGRQMAPECAVSGIEQFICVSTECHGYNRNFSNVGEAGRPTLVSAPVPELFDAYPDEFEQSKKGAVSNLQFETASFFGSPCWGLFAKATHSILSIAATS